MPKRIQMSRQRPWRTDHPHAVIVARPSKLGNPFRVGDTVTISTPTDMAVITMTPALAVDCYRDHITTMLQDNPDDMPEDSATTADWRRAIEDLAGRDLACWCPPAQPCHADVLLELANPGATALNEASATVESHALLDRTIAAVLFNVSNFPERAQARMLGQNMRPLTEKLVDAVQSAGFRLMSAHTAA